MKSFLQELSNSLRNNKLRTALTGFSIAWGIIILVVMLGAGKGVENGIRSMVSSTGADQVVLGIELRQTQLAYAGYQEGRSVFLNKNQFQYLKEAFQDRAEVVIPTINSFSEGATNYGSSYFRFSTLALEEQQYNTLEMTSGRLFTAQEHDDAARVVVISDADVTKLFGKRHDPMGELLKLKGLNFKIVGVIKSPNPFFGIAYVPLNTYLGIYPNSLIKISDINIYPRDKSSAKIKALEADLDAVLRQLLKVSPKDEWAINIESSTDQADTMDDIFMGLQIMLWIMGIGSLSIGTIGVSNIMHVTVQERMREIGIRKSIGAKPIDIMTLVLGESLLLSIMSGMIGLLVGVGLVNLLDYLATLNRWGQQMIPTGTSGEMMTMKLFENPQVNLGVAFGALIVLIVAGVIAGYGPARKAIKIPAIVAMRDVK
ncbi:ABC transporter permease [Porphyromonadaceae bacterium W3.11]|nr:ABC transporter permease [Porphyromonadaceae bacterium W3.11]